jgi:hypothetical protein
MSVSLEPLKEKVTNEVIIYVGNYFFEFCNNVGHTVERGDGSYDSTSLFLYIRQLL